MTIDLADSRPRPPAHVAALEALAGGKATPVTNGAGGHGPQHGDQSAKLPRSTELDAQLQAARRAARGLMTKPRLADAGYYLGSYYSAGVGTHFIDWDLVGRPFAPGRPAMLLVDTTPGHIPRLAGFSYWVRSTGPPEGFAGDADEWHEHRGLCFANGMLVEEGVGDPSACEGSWVGGDDLWMLHAWVVPGYDNPAGVFAATNRKLCPPRRGNDAVTC